jgi:hypothetical protein
MFKKIFLLLAIGFCIQTIAAENLLTVAETSNFTSTSRFKDVKNFFEKLQQMYPENIQLKTIGTTFEGNKILMVILGDNNNITPKNNRKPVIMINANIHAGEVEGKEAVQMFVRDILIHKKTEVLNNFTMLFIPVFNIDGNEKISPENRSYQKVKNGVGVRTNGMNMDLNRDFIKLESPEAKALVSVFDSWKPIVFVDCHTTDGSYHEEELTFAWGNHPNGSIEIAKEIYSDLFPFIKKFAFNHYKIQTIPYGNYDNPFNPKKWIFFTQHIVYTTSYFGVKGAYSFLNENYARADYKTRVKACYSFLDGIVTYSLRHKKQMAENVDKFRNRKQVFYYPKVKAKAYPDKITIKGFKVKRAKSGWYENTGIRQNYTVDFMGDFEGKPIKLNCYYVFKKGLKPIAEKLKQHGIVVNKLEQNITVKAKLYKIDSITYDTIPFQGHIMVKDLKGKYEEKNVLLKKGWYVVKLDKNQVYRQLVPVLLEPESVDSLLSYGYFNTLIFPSQWRKETGYYPVYRVDLE